MKKKIFNLDEIVFDKRNKTYGAYMLRKKHNKHLTIAFGISLFCMLFVIFSTVIAGNSKNNNQKIKPVGDLILVAPPPIDKLEQPLITPPPPPLQSLIKWTIPKITDVLVEDPPIDDDLIVSNSGNKNQIGSDTMSVAPTDSVGNANYDIPEDNKIFVYVEENPIFPGGDEGILEYLSKNIIYPEIGRQLNIQGKIITRFCIEKDGTTSNISISRSLGFEFDKEAKRVISEMIFTPGKQNGISVRVWYCIPIVFSLN